MFHDIKRIYEVDTRVNFIIKCENQEELAHLASLFNTSKKAISYEYAVNQLSKISKEHDNGTQ